MFYASGVVIEIKQRILGHYNDFERIVHWFDVDRHFGRYIGQDHHRAIGTAYVPFTQPETFAADA